MMKDTNIKRISDSIRTDREFDVLINDNQIQICNLPQCNHQARAKKLEKERDDLLEQSKEKDGIITAAQITAKKNVKPEEYIKVLERVHSHLEIRSLQEQNKVLEKNNEELINNYEELIKKNTKLENDLREALLNDDADEDIKKLKREIKIIRARKEKLDEDVVNAQKAITTSAHYLDEIKTEIRKNNEVLEEIKNRAKNMYVELHNLVQLKADKEKELLLLGKNIPENKTRNIDILKIETHSVMTPAAKRQGFFSRLRESMEDEE